MKRKRLILGGLIFVLLFSLLPTARARAEDPNLTGSWNGKHGTPVAGWDWDGDYGVRISVVDSSGNLKQDPVDFIQDMEAGNVVDAWFAETAFANPTVKKNKLQYKNGGTIALRKEDEDAEKFYDFVHLSNLPRTVGTKSKAVNIQTVRDYFDDDGSLTIILQKMANHLGTAPYTIQDLQAMNYYVMIEPIAIMRVALDGEPPPKVHSTIRRLGIISLAQKSHPSHTTFSRSVCTWNPPVLASRHTQVKPQPGFQKSLAMILLSTRWVLVC